MKPIRWAPLCALLSIAHADPAPTDDPGGWTPEVVIAAQRDNYVERAAVTATRTATPIEEVPQSIQSLTRTLIEDQDLQNLSAALLNVSGVAPTTPAQTVLQPTLIRGFAVNYYIDGVPTYQLPAGVGDPGTLTGVERVEVAKGPTATLYGGGTGAPLSGLVNLVSRDPDGGRSAAFGVRAGSFNTLGGDLDLQSSLGERFAFRLTGMIENSDSHIDFISNERYALFPSLSAQLGDDTRLVVRGRLTHLEQTEYAGLPVELVEPSLLIDRHVYAGARDLPRTAVDNDAITASLTHRFSETTEANVTLSRTNSDFEEWATFPFGQIAGTVYNFGNAWLPSDSRKTFATATVTTSVGTGAWQHRLLAGVDYDDTSYYGGLFLNPVWGLVDYAAPLPAQAFGPLPSLFFDQRDELDSVAAFIQDQISIGERLDVTIGLRWTQLDVRSDVSSLVTDRSDDKLTPRVGATFKLSDGIAVFAGYAEGFQGVVAGGFFGITPKPETSQAYEAGVKLAEPIDGLTGTVALYEITRQNVTTPDPGNPFVFLQSGEQRSRGLEIDMIYEPTPSLSLLFNYAYTDAEVTADNALPVGDRLRAVPEHAGRIAARYRFAGGELDGLELGAGISINSKRELTLPNSVAIDGLALVDAQVAYDFGRFSVALSAVNLFGEDGFEPYQYLGGAFVTPTQPRSAFVTLRTSF
jgi:iron complex outermembrane recepter protein